MTNNNSKYLNQMAQAERLNRILDHKKIRQNALAEQAQIAQSSLSDMKQGKVPLNDRLLKAMLQREDLGWMAIEWVFFGKHEQEIFGIAKSPSHGSEDAPESTIDDRPLPDYTLAQERAIQEFRTILYDPEYALRLVKEMLYIRDHELNRFQQIIEKIHGFYERIKYEQEKKLKSGGC